VCGNLDEQGMEGFGSMGRAQVSGSTPVQARDVSPGARKGAVRRTDGWPIGAPVSVQVPLVREGGANQGQLCALPDVGNDPLQSLPKALHPLLLHVPKAVNPRRQILQLESLRSHSNSALLRFTSHPSR